ncbi:ROK family transcriptional regulator [Cellulomonas sp. PhB150]|uniref:ROK family transcriptional regulator n=1 Tax=Cellulomonas sp. PhB150 TaxID=2485188 RepID=UPI000F4815E0|nr:ROK family transcriptional regulator [Cellulomonas sp. PhB150]ROS23703.1 putative NBD/HSP70 family sugar kinase [Cellulomonas sp. PhB150]
MSTSSGGVAHVTTRAALLDVIRGAGQISRVELTRATGLTGATVSTVVRRLIDDGLVVESGRAESTGGKPAVLLALDPDARYAVGIHLDHAGITYVLANLGGAIVGRWRRPGAGTDEPTAVVERIAAELTTFVAQVGVDPDRIVGLGVVSPGPLTGAAGMALTPPVMHAWTDYPLADALQRATGLPVMLENDATAAAVGEYWAGSSEASTCFAALYMGTGIGAGVMVHGDLYRGASSNTGEIGHICVDIDGPECWCGSQGCVEALAGPAAVVAAARTAGVALPDIGIAEDFAAVSRAAMVGQEPAAGIIERSARYVALAAQALANIMDLDRIVLTGPSFAHAGSLYVPAIQTQLDRSFFARTSHAIEVVISTHAAEAAAVGGAALVLQSELAPRASSARALSAAVRTLPAPHALRQPDAARA